MIKAQSRFVRLGLITILPNKALQTDKISLSRLLLTQKPRQLDFATER